MTKSFPIGGIALRLCADCEPAVQTVIDPVIKEQKKNHLQKFFGDRPTTKELMPVEIQKSFRDLNTPLKLYEVPFMSNSSSTNNNATNDDGDVSRMDPVVKVRTFAIFLACTATTCWSLPRA